MTKKIVVLLLILFALPCVAGAGSVILKWDASPDATGYKIYYGSDPNSLTNEIDAGNVTEYEITGLAPGQTYYFRAKSYDANGNESIFSTGAYAEVPLDPPIRFGR